MKKILALFTALCLLLGCAVAEEPAAPALQKDLVILFTSDVHCGIEQNWGYAGLYALKEKLSQIGGSSWYQRLVDWFMGFFE